MNKNAFRLFHEICEFLILSDSIFVLCCPLLVKDHVTLSITPVVGTTPVIAPTAGDGRWQTSPQYLDWTILQEVHQVNINLVLSLCLCFVDN